MENQESLEPKKVRKSVKRTLYIDIVSYFLALFSIAFLIINGFNSVENKRTLTSFAEQEMRTIGSLADDKIYNLTKSIEGLDLVSARLVQNTREVSLQNRSLVDYMLGVLHYNQELYAFYIAVPNGDFLEVISIEESGQTRYRFSDKPLPPGAAFVLRYISHTAQSSNEEWFYYSKDLLLLDQEKAVDSVYDPRKRPWYKGALDVNNIFWSDIYLFDESPLLGITCSYPIYDEKMNLLGVFGADISLRRTTDFLENITTSSPVYVFVLDKEGRFVIPHQGPLTQSGAARATQKSAKDLTSPHNELLDIELDGVNYIVMHLPIPNIFLSDWKIFVTTPEDNLFQGVVLLQQHVLWLSLGIFLVSALLVFYFSKRISTPIVALSNEINRLTDLKLDTASDSHSNIKEIDLMEMTIRALQKALRSFVRYIPKDVVKDLLAKGEEIRLGGEMKEIVLFFSDITSFTAVTESLSVEQLTELLSRYFDALSKVILAEAGTIDKYIGDGLMAFWGAPSKVEEPGLKACIAALRAQHALKQVNEAFVQHHLPQLNTRIGLHSGEAIIGNIGTRDRMNYTALGDCVNTASRLEGLNKLYQTKILLSEELYEKVAPKIIARPLDIVEVRGKKNKIKIYELIGVSSQKDLQPLESEIKFCEQFTLAFNAFWEGNRDLALKIFQEIIQESPDDLPTKHYLNLLEGGQGIVRTGL